MEEKNIEKAYQLKQEKVRLEKLLSDFNKTGSFTIKSRMLGQLRIVPANIDYTSSMGVISTGHYQGVVALLNTIITERLQDINTQLINLGVE